MQPGDIDVWLGLDVGKSSHHACALDHDGNTILDTPVDQDEKQLRRTIAELQRRGTVLVIVDQPNTIGSLPLTVARDMGARTAYLPVCVHLDVDGFVTISEQSWRSFWTVWSVAE